MSLICKNRFARFPDDYKKKERKEKNVLVQHPSHFHIIGHKRSASKEREDEEDDVDRGDFLPPAVTVYC